MTISMKYIKLVSLLGIAFFCLTACGQKGPLYLPTPDKAPKQPSKYMAQ